MLQGAKIVNASRLDATSVSRVHSVRVTRAKQPRKEAFYERLHSDEAGAADGAVEFDSSPNENRRIFVSIVPTRTTHVGEQWKQVNYSND